MAEHLKDMDWDSNSVYIVNITSVTSPEPDDSVSTDESKTFSEEIRQIFNAFVIEI